MVEVNRALEAAELLAQEGMDIEVIDPRTLKPLDAEVNYRFRSAKPAKLSLCMKRQKPAVMAESYLPLLPKAKHLII